MVRVASVKTKNGMLKRPIHKLAPLPNLGAPDSNSQTSR